MKFKIRGEVSLSNLKDINADNVTLVPLYRSNPTSEDIKWINEHEGLIKGGIACDFIWDMYYKDFADVIILSKKKFFEQIRKCLGCECKTIRISNNSIKYCFVDKMSSQHKST